MRTNSTPTWPSARQSSLLTAALVKPDWPTQSAYITNARLLGLDPAILQAFAEVEAGIEGGFLESGEPVILFERHHFHRYTSGQFDGVRVPDLPDSVSLISHSKPGGYGSTRIQHHKLASAAALDRDAALKSASWGLFQILGSNWRQCRFSTLQSFINAMYRSVDDHLWALTNFIQADARLLKALRGKQWTDAARIYNGPRQKGYDVRLKHAYEMLKQT